jgi:hypothetical protein
MLSNNIWHTTCTQIIQGNSRLLVVMNQIDTLTPDLSFRHSLCCMYSNGSSKPILDIYVLSALQWYKEHFNPMFFDPSNSSLKIQESNSQSGSSFGRVWVHSLTLFHTFESVNVIPGSHSWPSSFHALTLITSPRLR